MRSLLLSTAVLATTSFTSTSLAQIVLDGSADKAYGTPIVVQNTQTGFGDSNLGAIDYANGSELCAAYGVISDGILYLMIAGNLESNFNKLEVFVDAVPGGQNRLRGNNLDVDFNGLNRMGDDGSGNGLTFDADFEADLWAGATCGGTPFSVYFNYATLPTKGGGTGGYQGNGGAGAKGARVFKSGFGFGLNNSNVAGVAGGTEFGDGSGVSTGVEFQIPLGAIPGYKGGDVKVCAFINGQGHDYLSNQVLAPLGGGGNLAEPRSVNFENIPEAQYFVVSAGGGSSCPADLDGSGAVDALDLAQLLGEWGTDSSADFDQSGSVDAIDLAFLLGAWGECQ